MFCLATIGKVMVACAKLLHPMGVDQNSQGLFEKVEENRAAMFSRI
jgi:hypothetical protein